MIHHATRRAVSDFLNALDLPVDIGVVHPAGDAGQSRAWWQRRPLNAIDVSQLLPRLGRENAAGAAIYVRAFLPAGTGDGDPSPGLVLIDDLSTAAVAELTADGLDPVALVETSPGNHQAWMKLPAGQLTNAGARMVARLLAENYGGDPKAVAFAQPGRLVGFTNRKERHRRADGSFPFVRLRSTSALVISEKLRALVAIAEARLSLEATQGPRAGDAAETPPAEIGANERGEIDDGIVAKLDDLREKAAALIRSQIASGRRPEAGSSTSEVDFAMATAALDHGYDGAVITIYLVRRRPGKHSSYATRTVNAALRLMQSPPASERSP